MKILKNVTAYFATVTALVSLAIPLMVPVAVNAQTSPLPTDQYCYTFTTNLGEGRPLSQADADALRIALTNAGVWNDSDITTYNDVVASAVSGFQEKYASEILTPNGLSYGTGYVGASTRAELNSLYGCSTPTQPTQPTQCPAGYTCAPINQNPVFLCPTGWTCTPLTSNPTNPTNPVQSAKAPIINSIYPNSSGPGYTVTIYGSGFIPGAGVYFSGSTGPEISAASVSSDGTNLTFLIPQDSSDIFVPGTTYNVTVANNNGTPSSNSVPFTVLSYTCPNGFTCTTNPTQSSTSTLTSQNPTITNDTPSSGAPGTTVTLNGNNLGGVTSIIIEPPYGLYGNSETASYNATPTSVTASSVTFVIPTNAVAGTYNITAVAYDGQTHGTVPTSNAVSFTITSSISVWVP